jgi:hypothetical protein
MRYALTWRCALTAVADVAVAVEVALAAIGATGLAGARSHASVARLIRATPNTSNEAMRLSTIALPLLGSFYSDNELERSLVPAVQTATRVDD